jgi:uncharacterized protein
MRKHVALALLAGLLAGPAARPAAAGEKAADAKVRVVIIDGQNNHDWRATTPLLKKVLEDCGAFTVDVSSNLKAGDKPGRVETVPFPPDLGKYDAVLSNYNGEAWPAEFRKALEEYVKDGKGGLVIVHAANNAFPDWAEFNLMIGMGWRDNNAGDRLTLDENGKEVRVPKGTGPGAGHGERHPFLITLRDAEHPVTKGMPREWLHAKDELYHGMRGPIENVHLLATTFDEKKYKGTGEYEPMMWTVTYGKGRVFHTPMGHDLEAMRCVGFIATVQRGTQWAATGRVTLPLPENFPTAEKTSSLPAK